MASVRKRGRPAAALPIFWREGRAFLDGRRWEKGRAVALCAEGQGRATTDAEVAERIARGLVDDWEDKALAAARLGLRPENDLAATGDEYIEFLSEKGRSASFIRYTKVCLLRALEFFDVVQAEQAETAKEKRRCLGPRNLETISPTDVLAYSRWLQSQGKPRRGRTTMAPSTVREHLFALSGVFTYGIGMNRIAMGKNPVSALLETPSRAAATKTELMEPEELAALLESARTLPPSAAGTAGGGQTLACVYPLLAAYLYSGARDAEVRAIEVRDVRWNSPRGPEIFIRGTKTEIARSGRYVPIHPHFGEILRAYLLETGLIGGLLFRANDGVSSVGDWRKTLDRVAGRIGYPTGAVRTRRFRTSYATHRCTCDNVDVHTVQHEGGWSDLQEMQRTYTAAQRRSERMGPEFSYRLQRWEHLVEPAVLDRLAA
jgi:integrase